MFTPTRFAVCVLGAIGIVSAPAARAASPARPCNWVAPGWGAAIPSKPALPLAWSGLGDRPADVQLRTVAGERIPLMASLDPLFLPDGAVTLFRPTRVLEPGKYRIWYQDCAGVRDYELVVNDASPALPSSVGSLGPVKRSMVPCAQETAQVVLQPAPEWGPFRALTTFRVELDGSRTLFYGGEMPYGWDGQDLPISFSAWCPGMPASPDSHDVARGVHRLSVTGHVAGLDLDLAPIETTFELTCPGYDPVACQKPTPPPQPAPDAGREEPDAGDRPRKWAPRSGGCSVGGAGGAGGLGLMLMLAIVVGRRSRGRCDSR